MAAGLGFKTFTTGEVLSASDVNGYLMQGINVFANTTARDAAITSPQEGQFAYTKDTNSLWYYTGSTWAASGATGDIEGVSVTSPITGGGTSGTVTIGIDSTAVVPSQTGNSGKYLTTNGTTSSWGTVSGGGMTQIASTSLSGSSTTVSSIPATYKTIFIVIDSLSTDTNAQIEFTVNSSTSGYAYSGTTQIGATSATYGSISDTRIRLSASQTSAASATSNAYALSFYNYASTTALKIFNLTAWTGGNVDNIMIQQGGTWRNSSAITSCTVTTVSGSFDGGTITVYGVN